MIGSRINARPGCAPKISCAIGTPDASVFFDPQKIAATLSSRENPSALAAADVNPITSANRAAHMNATSPTCHAPGPPQTPCLNDSQKDVYTSSRIVPRSTRPILALCRLAHAPSHGCSPWPTASGRTSQHTKSSMTGPSDIAWPLVVRTSATHIGVRNVPMRLDNVALNTAPATFPRAAAVSATDDDTVDGSAHK